MHPLGDHPEEESSPQTHVLVFYCELIQLSHVSHLYTKTGQTLTISYSLTFELSLSNLKTVWTLWILFIISLKQIEQKQDICTQLYDMAIYRYSKELPLLMDTAVWWCMFNEFRYRRMLSCHSKYGSMLSAPFPSLPSFEEYLMYTYKILGTTGSIKL